MKIPSFPFYTGDWQKDLNLRRCSHGAKGVWIDTLCLMHDSEERGVLITGGSAWSDRDWALAVGGNGDVTLSLIGELLDKGVARKRSSDGAIYCARMVREEEKKTLNRNRVQSFRDRAGTGPPCNAPVMEPTSITLQKSESENEKETPQPKGESEGKTAATAAAKHAEAELADEIYQLYPKKVAKPEAIKAIKRALQKHDSVFLRARTSLYAETVRGSEQQFIPYPATWFNGERFNDHESTWNKSSSHHASNSSQNNRNAGFSADQESRAAAIAAKVAAQNSGKSS